MLGKVGEALLGAKLAKEGGQLFSQVGVSVRGANSAKVEARSIMDHVVQKGSALQAHEAKIGNAVLSKGQQAVNATINLGRGGNVSVAANSRTGAQIQSQYISSFTVHNFSRSEAAKAAVGGLNSARASQAAAAVAAKDGLTTSSPAMGESDR